MARISNAEKAEKASALLKAVQKMLDDMEKLYVVCDDNCSNVEGSYDNEGAALEKVEDLINLDDRDPEDLYVLVAIKKMRVRSNPVLEEVALDD